MTPALTLLLFSVLLLVSALGLWLDRGRRGGVIELGALVVAAPLALIVVAPHVNASWAALAPALVIALLLRARDDLLHSECALKLLWVLGPAFALSCAGIALLTITTGTTVAAEQWSVIGYETEPRMLWTIALSLSLLAGVVLLGGAPFHFLAADLLQGTRPWIGPLSVAALQVCGAAWLDARLHAIETLPEAARVVDTLMGTAAGVAFAVGAATLPFQRRPERRVGTLASLNGALVLAAVSIAHSAGGRNLGGLVPGPLWGAHLALALAGAGSLATFLPVSQREPTSAPALFRRHPAWGALGLYSLASLAGMPGTPGSLLWLAVGRALMVSSRPLLLALLAVAWVSAFVSVTGQAREALGIRSAEPAPPAPVPREARWGLLAAAAGLVALWWGALR